MSVRSLGGSTGGSHSWVTATNMGILGGVQDYLSYALDAVGFGAVAQQMGALCVCRGLTAFHIHPWKMSRSDGGRERCLKK